MRKSNTISLKQCCTFLVLLCCSVLSALAQQIQVKGTVLDKKLGETIIGARIFPNFEEIKERFGKNKDEITDEELTDIFGKVIKAVNEKLPSYKRIASFKIRRTEFVKTTTSKIQRFKYHD